jgi:hypothetical protein
VERLLAAGSPALVQVTMETNRVFPVPGSGDAMISRETRRIDFHVPAVYVRLADTREGRSGPQRLAFGLWSRTLDPVRADEMADMAEFCPQRLVSMCPGLASGRVAARIRDGETMLWVELTNVLGSAERRREVLRRQAGHDVRVVLNGPCEVREDPILGMLVGRPPEGLRGRACGLGAVDPPQWDRSGREPRQATFLKRDASGEPRFVVICYDWVEDSTQRATGNCQLQGHFGDWPLFLWVPNNRATEWEAIHERVQGFLARHAVSRTD